MFGPCFVIQYSMSFQPCNHIDGKERAGCFTLVVFLVSCDCKCSVAPSRGAMGWSAVCDYKNSSSNTLFLM